MFMRLTVLLIAVVFLFGCRSESSIEKGLEMANHYADNGNPEKGLEILDSLQETDRMNKKERMYAELLRVKALDKSDIIPTNDSTAKLLLRYYIDEGNDRERHPLVLYYVGRTYTELREVPRALLYFHKALDACSEDKDLYLCSYIHSQMAGLFDKMGLYKIALRHHTKQLKLEELLKDSVNIFYTQTQRAFSYRRLGERDSAENLYRYLMDFVPKLNDKKIDYSLKSQMAAFLMDEGRYAEADSLLSSVPAAYNSFNMPAIKSILNAIDMEKGKYADVKANSLVLLRNGDIYTRRKAAENLAEIYLSENNLEEGLKYARMYKAMSDTITHDEATDYMAEMEAIYDYSETERKLLELKLENEDRKTWLSLACIVALLAIAIGIYFYFRHRLKETSMKLQIEESKREYSEYLRAKDREINELKEKKNAKENELAELKERKEAAEVELAELKGKTVAAEKELDELKDKNATAGKEIGVLKANIEVVKSELNAMKEERIAFENKFNLAEVSTAIIEKASKQCGKVTNDDFMRLEKAMEMENPVFINRLHQLNLKERDFRDAMLVVLNVPLKICADILNITPQGIANSRKRLFEKITDKDSCCNWVEYLKAIRNEQRVNFYNERFFQLTTDN